MTTTISTTNTSEECGRIEILSDPRWQIDTLTTALSVWPEQTARTFENERDAFRALLATLQVTHPGEHVVIQNGAVADHDVSRPRLLRRFFGQDRQEPVYIGFVGPRRVARVPTPLFRRP